MTPPVSGPVELLQRLLRFDTSNPPGNEAECIAFARGLLQGEGVACETVAKDPARPNLLARVRGRGDAPPLLLYGHVDVVPAGEDGWTHPPFAGELQGGWVWGRGALDMKGGVAMMLWAVLRLARGAPPAGDVLLALLGDEEAGGGMGARFLVEEHPGRFAGIRRAVGEFGGMSVQWGSRRLYPVQVAEKTPCRVTATVHGLGGHGAVPVRGEAMGRLGRLLAALDAHAPPAHVTPLVRAFLEAMATALPAGAAREVLRMRDPAQVHAALGALAAAGRGDVAAWCAPLLFNTVNPTIVRGGGPRLNVVPDRATVEMDVRLLPGFTPDDVVAELRATVGAEVELDTFCAPASPGEPDLEWFPQIAAVVREVDPEGVAVPWMLPATTDARHFKRLGIQTYGFTPMKLPAGFDAMHAVHAPDERIPAEAVEFGADALFRLLTRAGDPGAT